MMDNEREPLVAHRRFRLRDRLSQRTPIVEGINGGRRIALGTARADEPRQLRRVDAEEIQGQAGTCFNHADNVIDLSLGGHLGLSPWRDHAPLKRGVPI